MDTRIDTLLLLALPASGKSELRRYLASVDDDTAATDFGLGPTVQLDDYPYVHMMRRISEEMVRLGQTPTFFTAMDQPFLDGRDWGTLIKLVDEDYTALGSVPGIPKKPAAWMLDRFDRARGLVGIEPVFSELSESTLGGLAAALDDEVVELAHERSATLGSYQKHSSTVLIEFARGGPEGTEPPLPDPHGYGYSLRHLSADILWRSTILYVWVTPEESRRRNDERAKPGRDGDASILHHGVPEIVMRGDYGVDDFHWLLEKGGGIAVEITTKDGVFAIPAAVFDNRTDHTSFLRADESEWDPDLVNELHAALTSSFAGLQ
ncbi:MAG: hypothetical protein ABFS21_13055 [Actinomycetota bacterium]